MVRGEKITKRGYEVCLFPMDYLYCTQISSLDSYSHCCGHPCDWIGKTNSYPIYAPCSCHLTNSYPSSAGNGRIYTSDNKVWTPSGLTYVSFYFNHDDMPPSATTFSQGDIIAHTGMTGDVTGDHTHLDQTLQQANDLVYSGITCAYGNQCYMLPNSAYVYDVFYLSGSEEIVNTQGMTFKNWYDGGFNKIWLLGYKKMLRRKRGYNA